MQLTMYQNHRITWEGCELCELHETRNKMVFSRGTVPCDILMIGEAPGESENIEGLPFVGPAGYLLNQIIERSVPSHLKYAITNLVCCIPREEDGSKISEPPDKSVKACSARLQEFVSICDDSPHNRLMLIICIGASSRDWLDVKRKGSIKFHRRIPTIDVIHPAAILRKPLAQQSIETQMAMVTIATAIENLIEERQSEGGTK